MEEKLTQVLAANALPDETILRPRRRVRMRFSQTASLIQWSVIESPLGPLCVAASNQGLCNVIFGAPVDTFLSRLNPRARAEQNPGALEYITRQLGEYFAGTRQQFEMPLDLSHLTPFQQNVLQVTRSITAGTVWTYGQVAQALGRPQASRSVGQALGHNPVPIVIPCHRVIASDGSLGGYSAGAGLEAKRWLLHLEGAL
jgi:methylated-DNA-[protein]-cysteine S-methyltransferase